MGEALPGRVSICRTYPGTGETVIQIEIQDQGSGINFAVASMSAENFAKAVTGLHYVPAALKVDGLDRVGMLLETKEVRVHYLNDLCSDTGERMNAARAAIAPHEVDGWIGEPEDMLNWQRRVGDMQSVRFSRYVPRQEGGGQ